MLRLITAPTTEPVSRTDAKLNLREDGTAEDTMIDLRITALRERAEAITGRAFITQTWELVLDAFPPCVPHMGGDNSARAADASVLSGIKLGRPPLQSVTSIKYIDEDGAQQTLDPALYTVDKDSEPGWVFPAPGQSWPATKAIQNAVRIRYTAGYGAASDVPAAVKLWIHAHLANSYRNRESVVVGESVAELPYVETLLDALRIIEL